MERLGMRREALMQEATFRDSVWLDVLVYGILAREWQARWLADGLVMWGGSRSFVRMDQIL